MVAQVISELSLNMSEFNLKMSDYGRLTINSMRVITEQEIVTPNPNKEVITFQAGEYNETKSEE